MAKHERKVEHKDFSIEVKGWTEDGELTGYLSTFGNVDLGGDVVEHGAFSKTLKERPVNPLLWHHDPSEPGKVVGSFTGKQDQQGLFIKAAFLPDPDSQNVRAKTKALVDRGVPLGLSIGYEVIRHAFEEVGKEMVRKLKEVRLLEGSIALFPMNNMALVTGVKSEEIDNAPPEMPESTPDAPDSTPPGTPQGDTSEPEKKALLHLLDEVLAKVSAKS